jgi:HK97 family phage major capsid protein
MAKLIVNIQELLNKINNRDAEKGYEGSSYVFQRSADDVIEANEEKQYLRMTLTSETPIKDWFGYLILDHSPGAIITTRLDNKSCSWRDGHWGDQVGFIDDYTINANRKLEVGVLHSPHNPRAVLLYKDYRDKYRKNTSARFIIHKLVLEKSGEDEEDVYRALSWELIHGAAVEDGADPFVGVDRNLGNKINLINQRSNVMTPEEIAAKEKAEREQRDRELVIKKQTESFEKEKAKIGLNENQASAIDRAFENGGLDAALNVATIYKSARDFQKEFENTVDLNALADKFVSLGTSQRKFNDEISDMLSKKAQNAASNFQNQISQRDLSKFNLHNVIYAIDPNNKINIDRELGMIKEICQERGIDSIGPKGGNIIPYALLHAMKQRTLVTSTPTSAGNLVASQFLANEFIPLPRNKAVVDRRGARILPDLVGNPVIPTQTAAASGQWMTDQTTPPNASDLTTGQKTMTPKTFAITTSFSRLGRLQSTPQLQQIAVDDLLAVSALARDLSGHHGTNANGQPCGIVSTDGVLLQTSKPGIINDDIIDMETAVAEANLDVESMAYVTRATVRGLLKKRPITEGQVPKIWEKNEMNGYAADVSNQIAAGYLFFGDYSQLMIGEWGGIELVLDPFTSKAGVIYATAYLTIDVVLRYAQSFAFYKDIN